MNDDEDTKSLTSPTKKIKWVDLSDMKSVKKLVQESNQMSVTCRHQSLLKKIKNSLINENIDEALRMIEKEIKDEKLFH